MTDQTKTADLEFQLNAIDEKLDAILAKMNTTEDMVATVVREVKPTIDELMQSSLFKMLGMKKGK